MPTSVSLRDFALLQEEVKCLRGKMSHMVSTAGGYSDVLTSPGSSLYPDEYFEDCECINVHPEEPGELGSCSTDDADDDDSLGDLSQVLVNGLFVFDAIEGVFYLPPDSTNYENRNTGLSDTTLHHGCKDVWWYRKMNPNEDYTILWLVGDGRVMRSENAGRVGWQSRAPTPPTGYSLGSISFRQIVSDPFRQNYFYILAEAPGKTWIVKTTDDGHNWTWTDVTTYNSQAARWPIWMCLNGDGGNLLWVTTWAGNKLRALKINNDPTLTVSAEYDLGNASFSDFYNKYEILSPVSQVDTNTIWFYGRASDPQGLGLSHVIHADDDGGSWEADEQSWGEDWCGSLTVSLETGGERNMYMVRNTR